MQISTSNEKFFWHRVCPPQPSPAFASSMKPGERKSQHPTSSRNPSEAPQAIHFVFLVKQKNHGIWMDLVSSTLYSIITFHPVYVPEPLFWGIHEAFSKTSLTSWTTLTHWKNNEVSKATYLFLYVFVSSSFPGQSRPIGIFWRPKHKQDHQQYDFAMGLKAMWQRSVAPWGTKSTRNRRKKGNHRKNKLVKSLRLPWKQHTSRHCKAFTKAHDVLKHQLF